MNFDAEAHLGAVQRSVASLEREGHPARDVVLARTFATKRADLWDALTSPARIERWFLPISGDLRLGGRYQLQGNAGGAIEECDPPSSFAVTWEFGGGKTWLAVSLAGAEAPRLVLTHTSPLTEHWGQYGPGAVGVGWDLALVGLALHVADPDAPKVDENAFVASPEGSAFVAGSSAAWARAAIAGGEPPTESREAAERTRAFYTGDA